MRTAVATLCALLVAPHAFAQSEEALKDFFEGKTVVVKLDMPATQTGVDVFADARRPINFDDYRQRLKTTGIAIRSGESVMITKIRVKEKLIEFQLGGGGYGTFGDDTDTSGYVAGVSKSSREKQLEHDIKNESDPRRKRQMQSELDDLQRQRERQDQRNRAAASVAAEEKKQRIAYQRLHGGSRFNVRYQDGVPRGVTAGGVMAALEEYVDFPFADGRRDRGGPPRPADGDRPGVLSVSSLRKGMTWDEVRDVLGKPDKSADTQEGRMKVTNATFSRGDQVVDVQLVDGVLVKSWIFVAVNPFEVRLRSGRGRRWRTFRDPIGVLRATRTADVVQCLDDVDRAVRRDGCYAAGFVTYEAAAAFGLPTQGTSTPARTQTRAGGPGTPADAGTLPLACFGLFAPDSVAPEGSLPAAGTYSTGAWQPSVDEAAYADAIRRIKARIEAGDTYQINFTFRLTAPFTGDPLALLRDLDAAQDGPWGAYVDDGRHAICSASPELFFRMEGDGLECRPMKGTAPRGLWPAADRLQAERLRASEKNRAENVMVVDMVRNDLGRIADTGTVAATSLFDLERYPLQWQMTSTVRARARERALPRLFEALFPSGSVTGAPKHSAMAIIRELETRPRGIYTGAIGYLSPNGRGHFNVAIRTIAIDREKATAEFGVGSGVVWDSVERDDAECLLKAGILLEGAGRVCTPAGPSMTSGPSRAASRGGPHPDFQLLETIGWTPAAGFALLARHLQRLRESAECFGFECDLEDVRRLLDIAVADLSAPSKVRVLVGRDGAVVCEGMHLALTGNDVVRAALAADPIDAGDLFLYHKTTRRGVHERARASRPDAGAVLLWNTAGEVTEGTDANVVVELDGRKVTPPVECGLLAGTLRAELLETGVIVEQRVSVADLQRASGLWLINSVRGWMAVALR